MKLAPSKSWTLNITSFVIVYACAVMISACAGDKLFDQLTVQSSGMSGYIAVAGGATTLTAPGTIALFDSNGTLVRQLRDHYADSEVTNGLAIFGTTIFALVDGADRIESINPSTGVAAAFANNPQIAGNLRQLAADTAGYLYIVESNTGTGNRGQIEKIDSSGQRVGSPFINTDTGAAPACALQTPYGVAYLPTVDRIVVTNFGAGNLLFYNATTGACVLSVANALYSAGNAAAVVYHPLRNKLLITKVGADTIVTANMDGTSPTTAYNNTTRVQDPYAIAVDSAGYVYVGSAVQDSVEKFTFDGTTLTPVSGGPFIQTGIYVQNPNAIVVFP